MSMDESYQGHANYATWCVSLWIDNEEPMYRYWQEAAQEAVDNHEDCDEECGYDKEAARRELADHLRTELEEMMPDLGASCWSDMLTHTLAHVDFDEIAGNMLEDKVPS